MLGPPELQVPRRPLCRLTNDATLYQPFFKMAKSVTQHTFRFILSMIRRSESGNHQGVLGKLWDGLQTAVTLNIRMLLAKLCGKKTLAVRFNAATQFKHLEPVLAELRDRSTLDHVALFILTNPAEIPAMCQKCTTLGLVASVHSDRASRFLLFCDFVLSVDQGMIYPYIGCRIRACSFHGQPSKGNTYQQFNHRQINTLFFYGPLMRDCYLAAKTANPSWPDIAYWEVGQPLSDRLFTERPHKATARRRLRLEPSVFTVVYAPSFEYCSSMATNGAMIIDALLSLGVNVIVKPHPTFYNVASCTNAFNHSVPNIRGWCEQVRRYDANPRCVFRENDSLNAVTAIGAADVMVTDFSGIAFDGILLDLGMIYWDCPLLYSEYLPKCYGLDGEAATRDLACNVGREVGIIVHDCTELAAAIAVYRNDGNYKARDRDLVRRRLLFNPGGATEAMAKKVEDLIGIRKND